MPLLDQRRALFGYGARRNLGQERNREGQWMAKEPYCVWVSWMHGTEDISHAVEHDISAYAGVVPSVGDRIVTWWPDGWDTYEVVERYLVQSEPDHVRWHIILQSIVLPIRRDYALHLTAESKQLQARMVDEQQRASRERVLNTLATRAGSREP